MNKKTIYLAGKVTGLPQDQVIEKFRKKQIELESNGHTVLNPLTLVKNFKEFAEQSVCVPEIKTWEDEMKVCISDMVFCDELHLMPCWQESRGATLERDIALRLNIPIVYH